MDDAPPSTPADPRAKDPVGRALRELRPGFLAALGCGVAGVIMLLVLQPLLPNPYIVEGAFFVLFLCYSAVFLGYAIARGHDSTRAGAQARARVVRAAVPYTGKHVALWSLALTGALFVLVAAIRTPSSISTLRELQHAAFDTVARDAVSGFRLEFVSAGYKSDARAFWRKAILGLDTLQVKVDDERALLVLPSSLRSEMVARMSQGFVLGQRIAPGEYATVAVHDHLEALARRPVEFVLRTFAFTLMEGFRFLAAAVYIISLIALIAHRQEKFLRQRLFDGLAYVRLDDKPRVRLRSAPVWMRMKYLNPLLCLAYRDSDSEPYLVNHRRADGQHRIEEPAILIDLLAPEFGPMKNMFSLLFPKKREQVNPIHRRRLGFAALPLPLVEDLERERSASRPERAAS